MMGQFQGVHVALVTPMTEGGDVDSGAIPALIDYLIDSGIHGIVPLGSTGEFYALTTAERQRVVDETIRAVAGRVPVTVGTNGGSTSDAMAHSVYAQEAGADAILLAAPYYSLPTADELYEHFAAIEKAIDLPIILYNYPGRTGVDLTPALVARLAKLPGIQFVKESTGQLERIPEIQTACGDSIDVLCGCDALALESFQAGAVGWITGAANVLPAELVQLYELHNTGREGDAQQLSARLESLLAHFEDGLYTQKVKAGCALAGHPVGDPRPPLRPLGTSATETLRSIMEAARH